MHAAEWERRPRTYPELASMTALVAASIVDAQVQLAAEGLRILQSQLPSVHLHPQVSMLPLATSPSMQSHVLKTSMRQATPQGAQVPHGMAEGA